MARKFTEVEVKMILKLHELSDSDMFLTLILPIPIWWLNHKLKENGKLRKNEARICY